MKVVSGVEQPTRKEYEEHVATHAQYRSWCPHCEREGTSQSPSACRETTEGGPRDLLRLLLSDTIPHGISSQDSSGAVMSLVGPFKGVAGDEGAIREVVYGLQRV